MRENFRKPYILQQWALSEANQPAALKQNQPALQRLLKSLFPWQRSKSTDKIFNTKSSHLLHLTHDLGNGLLGITKQHEAIGESEKLVFNSSITFTHASLPIITDQPTSNGIIVLDSPIYISVSNNVSTTKITPTSIFIGALS